MIWTARASSNWSKSQLFDVVVQCARVLLPRGRWWKVGGACLRAFWKARPLGVASDGAARRHTNRRRESRWELLVNFQNAARLPTLDKIPLCSWDSFDFHSVRKTGTSKMDGAKPAESEVAKTSIPRAPHSSFLIDDILSKQRVK